MSEREHPILLKLAKFTRLKAIAEKTGFERDDIDIDQRKIDQG